MEPTEPVTQTPPRALAQGVGVLLQTVGVLLFLTTCCLCSTSFLWDPILAPDVAVKLAQHPRTALDDPGKAGVALTIITMSAGGLALATFGLGLQADRRRAAIGALFTAGAMTVILLFAGSALWRGDVAVTTRIGHAGVTLIVLIALGFAIAAWRQVRAEPPPDDVDIVPPGTKIPYSFYHEDPPDVRLQRDIDQKRRELDDMERALREQQDDGEAQ